jgi:site-specific DNA-methyltransferase (adenine-specific)
MTAQWINQVFCEDALAGLARIPDAAVDLILTDPPYNLGKDYGNDSDTQTVEDYLRWTEQWIDAALPKLKPNGSLYIFLTWRFSPEIFVLLKQRMTMMNEIIWDRRVPSMGGSVRSSIEPYSLIRSTCTPFLAKCSRAVCTNLVATRRRAPCRTAVS